MAAHMVSLVVGLALLGHYCLLAPTAAGASDTPSSVPSSLYVFGDSLMDSGNNNYLATTFRADSPPYGIDSPTGRPSGRFSNYRNLPDFISLALGLPEPPSPFLDPHLKGERLRYGCNFASGGAGILNDTGLQQGNVISITEQVEAFKLCQDKLAAVVGGREQAQRLINQGVVIVYAGREDIIFNYFSYPFSPRATQYTINEFVDYLISGYKKILLRLYELGGRRFVVLALGPFGCWPAQLAMNTNGDCNTEIQYAVSLFNSELNLMTRQLNVERGGVYFVAGNTFMAANDFRNNPEAYGFTETKVACCGQGPYNGLGQCTPASNLCPNRDEHVYWDSSHPTDKATALIVQRIMDGPPEVISPMNLNDMMAMN